MGLEQIMRIELSLFATLSAHLPKDQMVDGRYLDVEEETTISDIIRDCEIPLDQVKLIFVNGVHAEMEKELHEGDRLGIFPPIGGG